jgi:hypothetical protein
VIPVTFTNSISNPFRTATATNAQKNSSAYEQYASCYNGSATFACGSFWQTLPTQNTAAPDLTTAVYTVNVVGNSHFLARGSGATAALANADVQGAVWTGVGPPPVLTVTGSGCVAALAAGATVSSGDISMAGTTPGSSCTFTLTLPAALPTAPTEYVMNAVTDRTSNVSATQSAAVSVSAATFYPLVIAAPTDKVTYNGGAFH